MICESCISKINLEGLFLLLIRISGGKWMEQLFFVSLCLASQETIYGIFLNVKAFCKWSRGGSKWNCRSVEWKIPIMGINLFTFVAKNNFHISFMNIFVLIFNNSRSKGKFDYPKFWNRNI